MNLVAFNIAFLLPAAFAALAAVLLPLLIHLARRSEQRPIDFAALRWLRQKPKPRHRIRFDEWPLLLLRALLVIALAVLLARPVLYGSDSQAPWLVAAPGVDATQARAWVMPANARRHWLAPGFPPLEAAAPTAAASPASLLRELDARLPAGVAVTVLVPAQLDGVDAQRPQLSRRVDWRVLPGTMPPSLSVPASPAPALTVRYASDRADATRYLRAAHSAWQSTGTTKMPRAAMDIASPTQPLAADTRALVWLVPGPLPPAIVRWISTGGIALLDSEATPADMPAMDALWHDEQGAVVVEGTVQGRGRVMRLTRPLTPQATPQLLDPQFPQRLRALFDAPTTAPSRVSAADFVPTPGGPAYATPPRDLQPWLALLIAALFVLERWLASSPRRGVAP